MADTIEARFAYSGKVAGVYKKPGDKVKRGEMLASLDRTLLQKELDRQLADYEKTRAGFEIFGKQHPNPGDDLTKYAQKIEQAQLDVSVKEVEIAKLRLDQADLVSPVNGIVMDDGGNRPGLNVSPASNAFLVMDMDSMRLVIEVPVESWGEFDAEREVKVKIGGKKITGKTRGVIPDGKQVKVEISLAETAALLPGMKTEVGLA